MLNKLIKFSLSQRATVLALATALLFLGLKKALDLPVDVLPDLTTTIGAGIVIMTGLYIWHRETRVLGRR